jgi:hypothetical protein
MSVTARTEITEVAELHDWAHSGGSAATLTRGDVTVELWFNAAGAVTGARRSVRGGGSTYLGRSASGKRDVVLFWLTDDPEPVAAEAAELPTVDQVAAAVQLPEWGTESAADTIARTQAVAASIASGTAASRRTAPPAAEAEPVDERDAIHGAGIAGGWGMFGTTNTAWLFVRDDVQVAVAFTADGRIQTASRRVAGVRTPEDTQQMSVVIAWLEPVEETYRCETCGATVATVDQPEHVDNDPAHRIAELEAEHVATVKRMDNRIQALEAQLMRATTLATTSANRVRELVQDAAALQHRNEGLQTKVSRMSARLGRLVDAEAIAPGAAQFARDGYTDKPLTTASLLESDVRAALVR